MKFSTTFAIFAVLCAFVPVLEAKEDVPSIIKSGNLRKIDGRERHKDEDGDGDEKGERGRKKSSRSKRSKRDSRNKRNRTDSSKDSGPKKRAHRERKEPSDNNPSPPTGKNLPNWDDTMSETKSSQKGETKDVGSDGGKKGPSSGPGPEKRVNREGDDNERGGEIKGGSRKRGGQDRGKGPRPGPGREPREREEPPEEPSLWTGKPLPKWNDIMSVTGTSRWGGMKACFEVPWDSSDRPRKPPSASRGAPEAAKELGWGYDWEARRWHGSKRYNAWTDGGSREFKPCLERGFEISDFFSCNFEYYQGCMYMYRHEA